MKKIMILYTSYGTGHYRAADGIKKYIEENYPKDYQVELIDGQKYVNETMDKVIIKSYMNVALRTPKVWAKMYTRGEKSNSLAGFSNGIQKLFSNKLYGLFKDQDPDLVISTHFFTTEMVATLKKKKKTNCKLGVILTDYAPHKFWLSSADCVDMYFVANEAMKYTLVHENIPEEKIYVTGIPVRPEFLETYDKKKVFKEFGFVLRRPTFLFFSGSQYGMADSTAIYKGLLDVKNNIQIIAISGKNEELKKNLTHLAKKSNKNVKVLDFTDRVAEFLAASDFVVSKPGGLTVTEALVTNTPFIIINPLPGQEEENSAFLTNSGAAYRIYDPSKTTPLIEQLLADKERIKNMKLMQRHIAKPNSTKDIVEISLKSIS